jgi:hypothetical protein
LEENVRYTKTLKQESESREQELQKNLKDLLEQSSAISQELHTITRKFSHWILWQRVWGVFKVLIIIIPIILGIIYLPSLLKDLSGPYQQLLNISSGMTGGDQAGDLLKQLTDKLNNGAN